MSSMLKYFFLKPFSIPVDDVDKMLNILKKNDIMLYNKFLLYLEKYSKKGKNLKTADLKKPGYGLIYFEECD